MLEIGFLVDGKYKILSKIGHGGMSNVYMAINERANKTWAIKEVRKNGVVDFEAIRQGLVTETNILKSLKHPNLPSIVDVMEDEESLLIVMDYIEGNSLSQILYEYGAIPQQYVISWAKSLCDVLVYLHTGNPAIIYRDMKPENIMLKPDGSLMLIDFGTAREFKEQNQGDTVCLGTVGYAAPEQFGGLGQTDVRTDIYGLGATMYHLITGCNPANPPYEMRPIRQINPSLSDGLEQIIMKCTQKNPNDRYQSAAELMYALEHYEEMDGAYRKRQKRQLIRFCIALFCVIVFGICGIVCDYLAATESSNLYHNLLDAAQKATNYEVRKELYSECMMVPGKSGELQAYLGLIEAYKENDMKFTVSEANQLGSYIYNNKKELQKNRNNYVEICFQMGKLYWYYFVDESGSSNPIVRGKYAAEWFQDVLIYAVPEYENISMAQVYARIGKFYRDITMDVIEANDKGKYALLYEDIRTLLDRVASNKQESEIVRLELLGFSQKALLQYIANFRKDGVCQEDLRQTFNIITNEISEIKTTTERTEEKRKEIALFCNDTKRAIESAFEELEV